MGVDRLSADPGRPSDVLDARLWLRAERLGCRLQDRGEVLLGVGSPPPSPDLGLAGEPGLSNQTTQEVTS